MHCLHEQVYRAALRLEHSLGHVAEILTVCLERQRTVTLHLDPNGIAHDVHRCRSLFPLTKPGQRDS